MDMTTYLENAILNHTLRNTALTSPAAVYLALWDGDPTDTGAAGTEVTTTVRAAGRLAITFGAPSGGACANTVEVDFGLSDGAADVSHVGVMDAASAGNMLYKGEITGGSQAVVAGNQVSVHVDKLSVTLD